MYFKDAWSYIHLFGSTVLFLFLELQFDILKAAVIVFILGTLWELCDGFIGGRYWFFDPAGFDYRDVLMVIGGIFLGILYLYLKG